MSELGTPLKKQCNVRVIYVVLPFKHNNGFLTPGRAWDNERLQVIIVSLNHFKSVITISCRELKYTFHIVKTSIEAYLIKSETKVLHRLPALYVRIPSIRNKNSKCSHKLRFIDSGC